MIDRYSRKKMKSIWEEDSTFDIWLKIEIATCQAWAETGLISKSDMEKIKKAKFNKKSYDNWFSETKHDLVSFTRAVGESLGDEKRWIHHGLTSNDVKDTALSLQLVNSLKIIDEDVKKLKDSIKKRALEFKNTPCIGRSHGIHAEPMSFGLKLALWWDELNRHEKRINQLMTVVNVGKISGPVGSHASIPPSIEEKVCELLGIKPAPVSNQIIQRDRHADCIQKLSLICSSIEKFATEIRSLQRTEIGEVQEPFGTKGFVSTGSSSMPHKRNPELSERICGLARIVRSNSITALENIPLWHERDISHSSSERIIIPDSFLATDYIIDTFEKIISKMDVFPKKMYENLNKGGGIVFSERIMLALVEKGVSREDAYQTIQKHALDSVDNSKNFKEEIQKEKLIKDNFTQNELSSLFDYSYYLRFTDEIFSRLNF